MTVLLWPMSWWAAWAQAGELPEACAGPDLQACVEAADATGDHAIRREATTLACTEGDLGGACRRLGALLQTGRGGPRDTGAARAWFERACDLGDALGCFESAKSHAWGFGGPLDYAVARDRYVAACDQGMGVACNNLGVLHRRGQGVPRHPATAAAWFDRACELDLPLGCGNLSKVLPPDSPAAFEASAREVALEIARCEEGSRAACVDVALRRHDGDGLARQRRVAAEALSALCDGGYAQACAEQVRLTLPEEADAPWSPEQLDALAAACDDGGATGCRLLGRRALADDRPAEAATFLEAACDLGDHDGCEAFGDLHLHRQLPEAVPRRALRPLWASCLALDSGGCISLATALSVFAPQGPTGAPEGTAAALAQALCDRQASCDQWIRMLRRGIEVPPDPKQALAVAWGACREDDDDQACLLAARMTFELGKGVADELELLEHACESLHSPTGCARYGQSLHREGQLTMARDALQQACNLDSGAGCGELAELFALGRGARVQPERAAALRDQACRLGHSPSCMAGWLDEEVP